MEDNSDIEKIFIHWVEISDKDFTTMMNLYTSKDYNWSLFIGHLVIERLLKASVVKHTSNHPPFTHDLSRLAELSDISFSNERSDWLDTITTFNLNTRYDSYKEAFYRKCNYEFTTEWIEKIKLLRTWIKEKL